MKKVLPVAYPIVTGYPVIANALSILQTNKEAANWILLNLVVPVVLYDPKIDKVLMDLGGDHTPWNTRYLYDDCPYLTVYRYDRTWFFEQNQDILSFVKWNIDRGRYLYTDVCRCFIPEYFDDDPKRIHDLFLYGYDEEEKLLFCSDFFDGKRYQSITVSFDDYKNAFEAVERQKLPHRVEQTTDIMAISNRERFNTWLAVDYENTKCVFGILKERILECLGKPNVNYMRLFDKNLAYGIGGYDLLQRYFQEKVFYAPEYSFYNCICVQFLVEHKGVLLKICGEILKNVQLSEQARVLVDLANIVKGFVLKSMIRGNCAAHERKNLIGYLDQLKEQEADLLKGILAFIDGRDSLS